MLLISASGIRHYFHKVHIQFNNLCKFLSGTLNKCHMMRYVCVMVRSIIAVR